MLKQMLSFFPETWMMKWGSPSTEGTSENELTPMAFPCATGLPWPPGPVGRSKAPITLNLDQGGAKKLTIIVGAWMRLLTGYGTKGDQTEQCKLSWRDLGPPLIISLMPLPF